MLKKILCFAMILVMVASMAVIGVSAADTKVYFEVPEDWNNYKFVYCHIWAYGSETPLANWQSKKEQATLVEGRLYSYDIGAKVKGLEAGTTYCIIFSLDTGMETYTTLMTTACYGDTLYCNDTYYENPVDSSKTSRAAFWKNHSASEYGPLMQVTSIGNIVGTCLAPGATAKSMFSDFLTNNLDNARTYSGKEDQAIIDDIAKILGLSQDTVESLIKESGKEVNWEKAKSEAPKEDQAINKDAIATGQETTIVYIALAMMLASAAVVFFARKKRVTE